MNTKKIALFDIIENNKISEEDRCEMLDYLIKKNNFSVNEHKFDDQFKTEEENKEDSLLLSALKNNNIKIFDWLLEKNADINLSIKKDQFGNQISKIVPYLYEKRNNFTLVEIEERLIYLIKKGLLVNGLIPEIKENYASPPLKKKEFIYDLKGKFTLIDVALSLKQFNLVSVLINNNINFVNNYIYNVCEKAFKKIYELSEDKTKYNQKELEDSLKYYSIFAKSNIPKSSLIIGYLPDFLRFELTKNMEEKEKVKMITRIILNYDKNLPITQNQFIDSIGINKELTIKLCKNLMLTFENSVKNNNERNIELVQNVLSPLLIKYELQEEYPKFSITKNRKKYGYN